MAEDKKKKNTTQKKVNNNKKNPTVKKGNNQNNKKKPVNKNKQTTKKQQPKKVVPKKIETKKEQPKKVASKKVEEPKVEKIVVEEKTIMETFSVSFNTGVESVDKVREYVINFIDKCDYIDTESYVVEKGKIVLEIIVRKADILKMDKFIHKVVTDFSISNYEIKKISESKLEDTEEL